ncbi:MAG: SDR family NAD(P)-dependent oxidoreductase [Planctomycetes bacterium]|nr:SDR family NAD(P)-dependent oxidoreductase [Planctomycetota bacterium]
MTAAANRNEPLAIVGIGCLFPKAAGPGFYWANVKQGVDCIDEVPATHWNPADYFDADPKAPDMTYARRGGFLDVVDFNPLEFGIAPRDIEATDTTQLLGLVAAKQALTDAGIRFADRRKEDRGPPKAEDRRRRADDGSGFLASANSPANSVVDRSRVSVILGVTGTLELVIPLGARLGHPKWKQAMRDAGIPADRIEDASARIAESYVPWQENSFPGLLGNVVAGRIANRLDLGGTNCVVDAACASSLSAVHLAAMELQTGRADVVVTGGCDTFNDIFMYMCFSKTPALSATGNAKPFDANGDGTILGEGLGMVVLKRLSDAEAAGDTIYAVIRGIGSSSDGKGNAIYAPSAEGQRRCLKNAYAEAGITPDTIELVEAHGTGTKVGDATEVTALTEIYGSVNNGKRSGTGRPWAAIGSVKSQIGHTKAAAGAASLIKVALALHFKVLPPTIKVTQPVEPLASADSPFYVNLTMRPWLPRKEHPRRAAVSAFGFGGSNFHAVLEEYGAAKTDLDWDGSVEIVAIGADTPQQLVAELEKLGAKIHPSPTPLEGVGAATNWASFARFAERSRSSFDVLSPCRLTFAAHRTLTDLPKLLNSAKTRLIAETESTGWHTPDGVFYGRGPGEGLLGVLFPGQGSQSVGMLRDLACLFPEVLESLAEANRAVTAQSQDETDNHRLSDRIYPPTSFDPDAKKRQDLDLRDTANAQPALGAVSFGAWQVLSDRFGVLAGAFAGHSYGELVALAAAGRFSPADLFSLSRLRGRLMGERRSGDAGAMLAVLASIGDIEAVIREHKLDLIIANRNGPKQSVLSGATAEIERAQQALGNAKLKSLRLPVAAAFHSPFVADAAIPFRAALDGVEFGRGAVPVFANTTAAEYPADVHSAQTLLANQLANPVAFVEEIKAMVAAGVKTFLEVGPGTVLTKLVEAITEYAGITGVEAFALDASGGKQPGVLDLGRVLARLAARGHRVELAAWEAGSRCRPIRLATGKPGMTMPLTGANYVTPRTPRPPTPPDSGLTASIATRNATEFTITPNSPVRQNTVRVTGMNDAEPNALTQALLMTQQSLASLQRMQEQTASLHKQFLDSQEAAQRTLQSLIEQQQTLLLSGLGTGVSLPMPAPQRITASPPPPQRVAPPPPVAVSPPPSARIGAPQVKPAAPAPVVQAPVAAKPKTPSPAPAEDKIAATLLAVVSEKTGYPVESLDLSLSLDGDLGVDSIKRVEILSTLQEKLPDSPQVKPEHLGTLHTLRDVANFLTPKETVSDSVSLGDFPADDDPSVRTLLINKTKRSATIKASSTSRMAPPATPPVPSGPDVAQVLLAVVSEKTGYPVDSLDLSLSLDGDLGVDSIKRVEILSALQEKLPDSPQVKPEHLGTLHTLRDVANFIGGPKNGSAHLVDSKEMPAMAQAPPAAKSQRSGGSATIAETDQVSDTGSGRKKHTDATRHPASRTLPQPVNMIGTDRVDRSILQPVDLDLTSSRPRVSFPPRSEFWVVGESDALTAAVAARLTEQGLIPKVFDWSGPVELPAASAGLLLIAPQSSGPEFALNRKAFEWLKLVGPRLRQAARSGSAVFVTVARLDGEFGLGDLAATADPSSGGLAGLAKTARHEWPELLCKALDLSPELSIEQAANAIVDETLTIGPGEVGISSSHRCSLELAHTGRRPGTQLIKLGRKDVILITGGARGVTAEVAVSLAETYGATVVLVGRTASPAVEPPWIANLTDEAEMKKAISSHLGADGGPKQVGEQYSRYMGQREIRQTLDRLAQTGARSAYLPVDITDVKAVSDLFHLVRATIGPITAVVHGAGVLADKRIEDLTREQFERVYATKVDGLRNMLDHLTGDELKALVLFSSTTARLGRTGQAAYACANEVLNKMAQVESRRRPGCRVVAINWGPWEGGMVTPGLRKVFEAEGVGLIPLLEGAVFLVQELSAGKSVEVVALGKQRPGSSGVISLGNTNAAGSGSGPSIATVTPSLGPPLPTVPASGSSTEMVATFERTVDPVTHPILRSHVLDGKAVLPMSLHLEWLAHAALHGNPGMTFHGFNDLRVTSGVQIDSSGPVQLRAFAGKGVKQDKSLVVPVQLRSKRKDGREAIHSRAEIVLMSSLPSPPPADKPPTVKPVSYPVAQAYRDFLFHGTALRGIEKIEGSSESAFIGTALAAPSPADWFLSPLRSSWIAEPLVLDASFQMMILWTQKQHESGSLPCFAGRYRQFRKAFPPGPTTVVIRVRRDDGTFARADIDYLDAEGRVIAQMQDYECVMEKSLNEAFRKNQLAR